MIQNRDEIRKHKEHIANLQEDNKVLREELVKVNEKINRIETLMAQFERPTFAMERGV